ncbi:hypothetical protein [Kutzneria albida]|uniref:Uncharacterized protein n=1 Tax=Kutzneria albida DSM 43870 TaxID=1449976 RepID=W5WLE3_9PSEU|nr:hypothetical protein [Kutzneria albida]AHI02044.1 hypothetical protein KALB_8687 [Kutzneria albida DSM 43870]
MLWLLIGALASLVVALTAGILKGLSGASLVEAVLYGGSAFATCLLLYLAVLTAARRL